MGAEVWTNISSHVVSARLISHAVIKAKKACRPSSNPHASASKTLCGKQHSQGAVISAKSEMAAPKENSPFFGGPNICQGLFLCCRVLSFAVRQCSRSKSDSSFRSASAVQQNSADFRSSARRGSTNVGKLGMNFECQPASLRKECKDCASWGEGACCIART